MQLHLHPYNYPHGQCLLFQFAIDLVLMEGLRIWEYSTVPMHMIVWESDN